MGKCLARVSGPAAAAFLFMFLALAAPLFADVIHLKDGGKVVGVILSDDGTTIRIRTVAGVLSFKHAQVASIEHGLTPEQEYKKRLAALKPTDAKGYYQLGLFCKLNGWGDKARTLFEKAVSIDPSLPGPNEELGHVKYEGKWMTPAARDALEKKEKAAAERGKEKRIVHAQPVPDKWLKMEMSLALTYSSTLGVAAKACVSAHFAAVGPYPVTKLAAICQAAEKTRTQFMRLFGIAASTRLLAGEKEDKGRVRMRLLFAKTDQEFSNLVMALAQQYPDQFPQGTASVTQGFNYFICHPSCYGLDEQMGDTPKYLRQDTVFIVSQLLLTRYKEVSNFFPVWVMEGFPAYQETSLLGSLTTSDIPSPEEANAKGKPVVAPYDRKRLEGMVKASLANGVAPSLMVLAHLSYNPFDYDDVVESWSFVDWAAKHHPKAFPAMVLALKQEVPPEDAVKSSFGEPWKKVQAEWQAYVKKNF